MKRLIWLTLATGALTTAVALAAAAQPMAAAPNVSCGTIRTPLGSMHITASHGVSCKKARTVIDDFLTHGGRFVGTDRPRQRLHHCRHELALHFVHGLQLLPQGA